jgi:hypothetical protein
VPPPGPRAELGADELDHLLDIFSSRARFSVIDIGDEVVLNFDGSGTCSRTAASTPWCSTSSAWAPTPRLYHRLLDKAVKTIVGASSRR